MADIKLGNLLYKDNTAPVDDTNPVSVKDEQAKDKLDELKSELQSVDGKVATETTLGQIDQRLQTLEDTVDDGLQKVQLNGNIGSIEFEFDELGVDDTETIIIAPDNNEVWDIYYFGFRLEVNDALRFYIDIDGSRFSRGQGGLVFWDNITSNIEINQAGFGDSEEDFFNSFDVVSGVRTQKGFWRAVDSMFISKDIPLVLELENVGGQLEDGRAEGRILYRKA